MDLMAALRRMYKKFFASNKLFLIKKRFFIMKIVDGNSITKHLKNFNSVSNQFCLVGNKFEDEVRTLLLISSLPNS